MIMEKIQGSPKRGPLDLAEELSRSGQDETKGGKHATRSIYSKISSQVEGVKHYGGPQRFKAGNEAAGRSEMQVKVPRNRVEPGPSAASMASDAPSSVLDGDIKGSTHE